MRRWKVARSAVESRAMSEPIRFRSQAEIDKMLERLERNKEYWRLVAEDAERRVEALKFVTAADKDFVIELALGRSSGYQETAADWLIFRCDDSRIVGNEPD
jgi:hypothetical protein